LIEYNEITVDCLGDVLTSSYLDRVFAAVLSSRDGRLLRIVIDKVSPVAFPRLIPDFGGLIHQIIESTHGVNMTEKQKGIAIGHTVHFVLDFGPNTGEHRAAIISNVVDQKKGIVNLQVVMDGLNDNYGGSCKWVPSVPCDPSGMQYGSWHFPERV
jgi:hypothetical protein